MPKLKPGTRIPSRKEDAEIIAAAEQDPDARPFSEADLQTARPKMRVGRPPAVVTKERITIRLSREVVERFRASGAGWQSRIDAALKDWLKTHRP